MASKVSLHPGQPDYYIYKKDDKWFKTDAQLTKTISAHIFASKAADLPKIVFYPNWNAKSAKGAKYGAWRVNENGEMVMRWYWKVFEGSEKTARKCAKLGDGRYAARVPAMIEWSAAAGRWVLTEMVGKAAAEEEKILDNYRW